MATIKTCDVVGCGLPARTIVVAIDTTNNDGKSIGVSHAIDTCDTHKMENIAVLFACCQADIEMTIISG